MTDYRMNNYGYNGQGYDGNYGKSAEDYGYYGQNRNDYGYAQNRANWGNDQDKCNLYPRDNTTYTFEGTIRDFDCDKKEKTDKCDNYDKEYDKHDDDKGCKTCNCSRNNRPCFRPFFPCFPSFPFFCRPCNNHNCDRNFDCRGNRPCNEDWKCGRPCDNNWNNPCDDRRNDWSQRKPYECEREHDKCNNDRFFLSGCFEIRDCNRKY